MHMEIATCNFTIVPLSKYALCTWKTIGYVIRLFSSSFASIRYAAGSYKLNWRDCYSPQCAYIFRKCDIEMPLTFSCGYSDYICSIFFITIFSFCSNSMKNILAEKIKATIDQKSSS